VVKIIEVDGEAAKSRSKKFEDHEGVPWKRMAGMRSKLFHKYFDADV
jgi:uncharacterized protein with HEPN domain